MFDSVGTRSPCHPTRTKAKPRSRQRRLGRSGPAPVGDRVIERPVPAGHVDRPVDLDRRPVFDPPSRSAGCVREVHDVLVAEIRRIDLTGNCAAQ